MDNFEQKNSNQDTLVNYVQLTIENESKSLTDLVSLVSASITIGLVNGQIYSDSKLTSSELELLAMKIPAECLRIQAALNRYSGENIFRDISIDTKVTEAIADMIGTKGNAEERKRKAELLVLDERTISAANKAIVKGLQASIERADKVYDGIKKVMDFRAREGWFDRKTPN